jgi:hypothetical protein
MAMHDKFRHESREISIVVMSPGGVVHQATTSGTSNTVGNKIEPGHSALFLLVESWTEDKAKDEIKNFDAKVLQTFVE